MENTLISNGKRVAKRRSIDHYSDLIATTWKTPIHTQYYISKQKDFTPGRFFFQFSQDIKIQVGDELISVPSDFNSLANEIEESKYILDLSVGWDDNKAIPIPSELWITSIKFLLNYTNFIYKHFSVLIDSPEINPCPNGSIDLSWRTKNARLLINIRKEKNETLAYFYGDLYDNKLAIKGTVPTPEIQTHLAVWMRNLI